ncbi:response regulator [Anaerolineales bacterium HSG24]|nr:response regulator [Anaerolineales bacterium HSG24]
MSKQKPIILVIDDNEENIKLLTNYLDEMGYQTIIARNGEMGIKRAKFALPDLILLDVMMPTMNGFEACQLLKSSSKTKDIPVIFLTALKETADKLKGFEVGGVDYITKPMEFQEVLVRVQTHIRMHQLQQQVEQQNQQLQEEVEERKQIEKEVRQHNKELNAFAHTVAHNLKNPLSMIITTSEYLRDWPNLRQDEIAEILDLLDQFGQKSVIIVEELLLLASVRQGQATHNPLDMFIIIQKVEQRLAPMISDYRGQLLYPSTWPLSLGHHPWIEEVWMNYLSNGLKYGGTTPRLKLGATQQDNGFVRFWVQDYGPGISPENQVILFTEFIRLDTIDVEGYGLGLSIVKRIIDKLGGQVGVESEVGQGSRFWFELPSADLPQLELAYSDDFTPTPLDDVHETIPSHEQLQRLLEQVRTGRIMKIRDELKRLTQQPKYQPFVSQVEQWLKNFQMQPLQAWLEEKITFGSPS